MRIVYLKIVSLINSEIAQRLKHDLHLKLDPRSPKSNIDNIISLYYGEIDLLRLGPAYQLVVLLTQ